MASVHVERIAHLDGWRALAIGSVLAAHYGRGWLGWLGDYGVELFFSLSGLLMAEILFVRGAKIGPFLVRRLTRVYPAMFVFITAMFIASIAGTIAGVIPEQMRLTPVQYLAAATFTTNYYYWMTGAHSVLGHTWSLGVELWAYVLLALVAAITARRLSIALPLLFAITAISMMVGALLLNQPNFGWESVYWRTDARLASIVLPAAIFLVLRERHIPAFVAPASFIVSMFLYYFADHVTKHTLGTATVALSICTLESTYAEIRRALSAKPFVAVGAISYSLYLWQQPFWKAAAHGPAWMSAAALVFAFIAAWASYRLVEGPARDWLNGHLLKRPAARSTVEERDFSPGA